jgi:hypothetical protein
MKSIFHYRETIGFILLIICCNAKFSELLYAFERKGDR